MNRKRKCQDTIDKVTKIPKINHINWNIMISPSNIRNYMIDDPLLDWLKYYNVTNINKINKSKVSTKISHQPPSQPINHTQFIMNEGLSFEQQIYNSMKDKYENIVQVGESFDARSEEKFNETVEYMKKGVDIIYQGVIHDYENNLFGCPDLLIRSDCFNKIFNMNVEAHGSIKLNIPFHYIVVDIKHSTLLFSHDKTHLLNSNNIPAYKGQLLIYNRILGTIQGYQSRYSYILGKKWQFTKNGIITHGIDYMGNLGIVDYMDYDKEYNTKIDKAIEWVRDMRTNGHKWKLLPKPNRPELYPNMKNDKDYPYTKIKVELSKKINEITSVWNCGLAKRQVAHSKRIYNWKNKRCNSINMGLNKNKTSVTIDHILDINRSNKKIRTTDLLKETNWRNFGKNVMEFYIDYETINGNIGQLNENTGNDFIFMIGIGWEEENKWMFKNFILEELTNECELDMMVKFWDFIKEKKIEHNKNETHFIHWTQAEHTFYNKFLNKHNYKFPTTVFYDMHRLFLDNNVAVNGSLDFKLKNIAKAMHKNKLIESSWDTDNPCANGLDAMYNAYNIYKNRQDINNSTMQNIAQYNEIDCKVMWEILKYLRTL